MNEAKTIRNALKAELGLNARQVGVRTTGGGSVDVTIKDPAVKKSDVEDIAKQYEHIDRCSVTQEILSGGNTFVFVRYSDAAAATMAAPYLDAVRLAGADIQGSSISPIGETGYGLSDVYKGSGAHGLFNLWANRKSGVLVSSVGGADEAAFQVALDLLEQSA